MRQKTRRLNAYGRQNYSDYCFIDDVLKTMNHQVDIRRRVSDSEILTTAIYKKAITTQNQNEQAVEATISNIKKLFPRSIHAITLNRFLIKITCFIRIEQF
ncbi:MAG: hypothetical protein QM530_09670 [Phycisphaerales bacterium]|nr:hypothetical protein [Phycisphaerales bacterium]